MVSNETVHHEDHVGGNSPSVLFFIFCCFGFGALMRQAMKFIPVRLAYTVVLLLIGVIFGLISNQVPELDIYTTMVDADPHLIMHVFLPVLIFESAFALDYHTFKKTSAQVLLLAVPGLALSSLLTCIMAQYLFDYNWGWNIGMLFGSLMSATDPVAVVAILREVGASKKLSIVIEGESLLNDGAAIVLFNIFLILSTTTAGLSGGEIVVYFLRVAIGGPAFGLLMAIFAIFCLSQVFNDVYVELTVTLVATYATFYIGEALLGVSGVLAVVVLGIAMSSMRTSISPEVEDFIHRFWEALAYFANTLIFILVGVVISKKAIQLIFGMDWFYMIALYLGLNVIRGTVVLLLSPILRRLGYGMTWQEGLVLTWGGLRGAVGLALGLLVMEDEGLDLQKVRVKVLIHISGIVFLTLLINATTIPYLLKTLGMNDITTAKRMAMASAIRHLEELRYKTLNMLKTDRFLADSDWELVEKSCGIDPPYKTSKEEAELEQSMKIRPKSICPDCNAQLPLQPTPKELRDMTNEAILRYLKAEKLSYWRQFEQGMVSQEAVRKLQGYTEVASDKSGQFVDLDEIKSSWEVPKSLIKLRKVIVRIIENKPVCSACGGCLQGFFKIVTSKVVSYIIFVIIAMDMVNWILSLISERYNMWYDNRIIFRSINAAFVGIYIVEFICKVITQSAGYFKVIWQVLCFVIVIHGISDVAVEFSLPPSSTYTQEVVLVFIVFRFIRVLRFFELIFPLLLKFVDYQMTASISNGYDVGRGFVAGEEEVRKLIDRMVDNTDCATYLKQNCDTGKLDVIRCLGILQKENPQIALSVKTRQAARSVLNSLRDGVQKLLEDGVLQESETEKLNHKIEAKMKKLLQLPTTIPVPPPDRMLNNVTWLEDDQETIDFIKARSQLINYNHDEALVKEGDASDGIYIIVSGLVRFSRSKKNKNNDKTEDKVMDFMSTGSIIGEMGLLTHGNRMASVVCETAVQALFISSADMEEAFRTFADTEPSLEKRLWKVCASRLAVGVLLEQPSYQGFTREKVKLRLESAYVVPGEDFSINSKMADVVLIHGHAQNAFTKENYHGPCYIPWTCLKLEFKFDQVSKPIMLVIPSETDDQLHLAPTHRRQSYHPEYFNGSKNEEKLCLKHAAQHRQDIDPKKKSVTFKSKNKVGVLENDEVIMNGNIPNKRTNRSLAATTVVEDDENVNKLENILTPEQEEEAEINKANDLAKDIAEFNRRLDQRAKETEARHGKSSGGSHVVTIEKEHTTQTSSTPNAQKPQNATSNNGKTHTAQSSPFLEDNHKTPLVPIESNKSPETGSATDDAPKFVSVVSHKHSNKNKKNK
ncbi:hypothetical protein LOTGIDRAFT_152631 [Lottia gigantea]|uniref:Cyclic nucleotide-binding domain-containing protein n=1 Tax=Lottia gigantea TaxID=225164 RepID=V4A142_LOTGI|nr:hypothetical protein LOTGIDRAFT_152631 [Lottia gigantea]ESO97538.1 hypothetical protein LOTGIDRAFT_152631 [Lottia gigantea]